MIEEDDPIDTSITDEAPVETDDGSDPPITDEAAVETDDASDPPITELDIRMIAAELHDQGRGHVLVDMIEAAMGVRPAEDAYSPRRLPIRDPEWRAARKKAERRKHRAERRARMTDEEKAKQIGNLQLWKAENPEKMQVAEAQRLEKKKAARKDRELVGVDLEGFDTGRYFTDDRPDYARELHEGIARGYAQDPVKQQEKLDKLLKDHIVISEEERLAQQVSFAGWTVHNAKWYLDQHDLSDDPIPSARNKLPGTPPIYIEHRPFLLGAGNDRHLIFIHEEMPPNSTKKIPLSGYKILNAIADLKKTFPNAIFIVFASGYDVSQILRCLDADTAGKLQAGEIVIKSVDDDGAPCEEVIEQAVFCWNEFAISYRRGKMFRVGRLNEPGKLYKYTEITDPERRQAYIDAGRDPVDREIDYKDEPITLNDQFGFHQKSFIEAYEGSEISYTLEEAKIIAEGKRKRGIMASLPMDEVEIYQGIELRLLCRMTDKLLQTTSSLGLTLPHLQGAGAISSAMANKHRAMDFYPKIRSNNYLPEQEWAHYCFAGGHIQMIMQGRYPNSAGGLIYGYDITSAYPSKQYRLPAQALPIEWKLRKDGSPGKVIRRIEGKWIWREGAELTEDIIRTMSVYSMIEVEYAFPEKCFDRERKTLRDAPWYPLFYRCKDGSILFTAKGIGRYCRAEVLQAYNWVRQMRPDMNEIQQSRMIKLRGAWEFICPTIDDLTPAQLEAIKKKCPSARIGEDGLVYPFQYIKNYYDERAKYSKTDSRNWIIKFGINGAWGKTAQSVGGRYGKPPASANPWVAAVVTSETRAQCIEAMLKAPWNIIHVATDGVQSTVPLGIESEKKILGTWEMETFTRGVYVKPGIYGFAKDFEKEVKDEVSGLEKLVEDHVFKGKSRGVSFRSVLGEDKPEISKDEKTGEEIETKRDIQKEWFDYLDDCAFEAYSTGKSLSILPHKKLVTFGLAASNPELWPMCGNWVENSRIFKMNEAGVKRAICFDRDRAHSLVVTKVAINKTPKVLSAKHEPEWLGENEALMRDLHDNADLALAHGWDCCWDVDEGE